MSNLFIDDFKFKLSLDIDGCILDDYLKPNVQLDKLILLLNLFSHSGVKIILNSNRSLENIFDIVELLKLKKANTEIIYENGLGLYKNNYNIKNSINFFDYDQMKYIILKEFNILLEGIHTDLLIYEPNKVVHNFLSSKRIFFYEKTRKYTATIYPRQLNNGNVTILNSHKVFDFIYERFSPIYNLDENPHLGSVTLTPKKSDKIQGIEQLISTKTFLYAFGDSPADILTLKKSDFPGCPANATIEVKECVKEKKGYQSTYTFTQGLVDYMNQILGYANNR